MPNIFLDERIARSYDADSTEMFDPAVLDPAIDFLAGLAAGSNALELGIGTGRVALPLSRRGVTVHGIDISPAMIAELRAKPGAEAIGVTMGDYATAVVGTTFRLAYAPFNAITNLMTQAEQVGCFRNMANHLEDGGYFVAEVFVPELQRIPRGDRYRAWEVTPTHLAFDEYDVVDQICLSHHYYVNGGKFERFTSSHRYVWPSELDLMAQLAGMDLVERWANWRRDPFTAESVSHISVWRKVSLGA